ncbi:MAG: Trk family potassium uptake protein [Oscillospiraceae bacterium]|nr:Trk family potassium uptake protein [Oscillospiraceae bacterium]
MPYVKHKQKSINSTAVISLSFLGVILLGTLLLTLPFSSASGSFTNPLTAFFTSVSATCVTGIVTVDTGSYWSTFGQIVILIMIQTGGLGLVTLVSFFNFMLGKKMELSSVHLASASINSSGLGNVKSIIRVIVGVSLSCELIGALLLMTSYVPKFGLKGVYISIYLSITSFCNAGFDIMGTVAEPFSGLSSLSNDPVTLIVIPLLVIAGGQGFFVWYDLIQYRNRKRFSFQTKLVTVCSLIFVLTGMLSVLVLEWNNPETLGGKSFVYKLANSFFCSTTFRSSGFNTFGTADMTPLTKIISLIYMIIGAAPGSTGGGIKITTFVIAVMTVVCVMRNRQDTIIAGRKIKKSVVYEAFSIMFILITLIILCSLFISFANENVSAADAVFEVTSALTTTGLSTGILSECGLFSKVLLHLLMFIGRVGSVSLALSFTSRDIRDDRNEIYPEGKLMVG